VTFFFLLRFLLRFRFTIGSSASSDGEDDELEVLLDSVLVADEVSARSQTPFNLD